MAAGDVLQSFASPKALPQDLTWDGTHLYNVDAGTRRVYRLTTAGAVVADLAAPDSGPYGLAWDGTHLWLSSHVQDRVYRLTTAGAVVSSFASPASGPSGLAWDGTHLWLADFGANTIYQLTTAGAVVTSFPTSTRPFGLAWDGTHLYVAGPDTDTIYRISTAGAVVSSFASPANGPSGLAWDGTHLYSADSNTGTIYRVVANPGPSAPIQTSPTVDATVDAAVPIVLDWTFAHPLDGYDDQTAYDVQVRPQASTVTTVDASATSEETSHTIASGTLTGGTSYEWRARTADGDDLVGPWSGWSPFDAGTPPPAPTITAPTVDEVVGVQSYDVTWTAADQDDYQVRTVADAAGNPDTSTIYYDSGAVAAPAVRNHPTPFPVNGRTEHVQVRVRDDDGLWSDWSTVRVDVDYTAPAEAAAVVTVNDPTGAISVAADHPVPQGTEPDVVDHDVEVTTGDGRHVGQRSDVPVRIAAGLDPAATHVDWHVASDVDYRYRIVARSALGLTSTGPWST